MAGAPAARPAWSPPTWAGAALDQLADLTHVQRRSLLGGHVLGQRHLQRLAHLASGGIQRALGIRPALERDDGRRGGFLDPLTLVVPGFV